MEPSLNMTLSYTYIYGYIWIIIYIYILPIASKIFYVIFSVILYMNLSFMMYNFSTGIITLVPRKFQVWEHFEFQILHLEVLYLYQVYDHHQDTNGLEGREENITELKVRWTHLKSQSTAQLFHLCLGPKCTKQSSVLSPSEFFRCCLCNTFRTQPSICLLLSILLEHLF